MPDSRFEIQDSREQIRESRSGEEESTAEIAKDAEKRIKSAGTESARSLALTCRSLNLPLFLPSALSAISAVTLFSPLS